jgi:dephospho-CoA kinase
MFVLGLTGSIGMGKSTTAQLFRDEGVPVYDADAAVHELYESDAVVPIEAAFPGTTADGVVDRAKLSQRVVSNPDAMKTLEAIVHPLVRKAEQHFLQAAEANGAKIAVLDIPLLFETGGDNRVDAVVVVTAPHEVQRKRVLERSGMTEEKLDALLAKQMPDADKRRRADFIVDTGHGLDHARREVREILARLAKARLAKD